MASAALKRITFLAHNSIDFFRSFSVLLVSSMTSNAPRETAFLQAFTFHSRLFSSRDPRWQQQSLPLPKRLRDECGEHNPQLNQKIGEISVGQGLALSCSSIHSNLAHFATLETRTRADIFICRVGCSHRDPSAENRQLIQSRENNSHCAARLSLTAASINSIEIKQTER